MKVIWDIYFCFFKIGAFMFGGGYSMLPLLERELVDRRQWTSEEELLDYFTIAQCTPGVIAINTATFIGHKQRGFLGGMAATLGVITVPMLVVIAIAAVLMRFWSQPAVQAAFQGVRVATAALIAAAVVRLVKSGVKNWLGVVLCVLAFAAVAFLGSSPVLVIACAALVGFIAGRFKKS